MRNPSIKFWKTLSLLIAMCLFLQLVSLAQVQLRVPRPSQGAKVSQTIGLSDVSITYSRPGVRGRQIWGKLVPFNEVWRTGANEPTLITFSDDVQIEGQKLAAGTYRLVTMPTDKEWTVIFNSEVKNWGTIYEGKYDVLKVKVAPQTGPHEEWMAFNFEDLAPNSARLVLAWDKLRLPVKLEFNTLAKIQASVGNSGLLNAAARFALTNKLYLNEAIGWADRSIALDKNYNNLRTKAELLAQAGKVRDAISTAEEAVKIGKAKDPKLDTSAVEKALAEWKGGK